MSFFRKRAGSINVPVSAPTGPLCAGDIPASEDIHMVGPESAAELAAITADAFRNDPFNNWLFKSQQRKHRMFAILAQQLYAQRGFCQILREDGAGQAASMWMMPGQSSNVPLRVMLSLCGNFLRDDGLAGVRRGLATASTMEAHHPREPHAYLFTVGVASSGRGRGLGRRLLAPVLAACDRTGTMAYLENSNPANTRFYNSIGFESISLFRPKPDAEPLEAMKRMPG